MRPTAQNLVKSTTISQCTEAADGTYFNIHELLAFFHPVFTAPSYATFQLLMTGWIISVRHRYVTDLIISSDSVGNGHFSDYHRFFSHASWDIDDLWKHLARLLIDCFFGPKSVILLAGGDTLCHKCGLGLFGAGMHHDPLISSRAVKLVSWGHDWVNLCLEPLPDCCQSLVGAQ